ncbi:unnamed protein product [Didymodactylos carnosus]|uniref:Uncharacterized protein n=1 Tax=Didymodactylos carnosus TaxID=1234261 RepID=A0A8S2FKC6_9BILA|nr:unnamed protein product [Didymodactylos carnosus]CAF4281559.1 unnamed protein product [Didymodactylos carnosus]
MRSLGKRLRQLYIQQIRQAFEWVELYFEKVLFTDDGSFHSTCIETVTPDKLVMNLATSLKFLSSDEDGPMTKMYFFDPKSKEAK